MSVYKDTQRGTWYVSYSFKDLPTGSFKHKTKRGFKTSKAAKEWERKNYHPVKIRTVQTFEDMVYEWEDNNQASKESRRHYASHLKYRCNTDIFRRQVTDISKSDLLTWRNELINMDYSTKTKNDTITFVRSVLSFATTVYSAEANYVVLKSVKKTDEEIMSEMNIWTPEEFNKFIKYVDDSLCKTFFSFLFWTGCRRGEAIALQKCNVHDSKVYICCSLRTIKEGLKPTKTKQKRWITMDKQLAKDINALKDSENGSEFIFSDNPTNILLPTKIETIFKKAISESGVKSIRVHDLRHSHASWLINNNVNIVAVSKRLGHSTIDQTLKTYTHLIKQNEDKLIDCIEQSK